MNDDDSDRRLVESLQTLREHDLATAPSFDEILTRRSHTPSHKLSRPALIAVAAAAMIIFWFGSMRQVVGPEPLAPDLGTWQSPTGFLLEGFGGNLNYSNWRSPTSVLAPPTTRERNSR